MKFSKSVFSFFVLLIFILGSFYVPPAIAGNVTSNLDSTISDDWDINFIVLWPLDENFKILEFNLTSCTLYPYLKNRLISYYINATEALEIEANVYIGCPNVSGMKVEVLPPNITQKEENFRYVTVPVNVYTNLPFPHPVELRSSNVSISYEYHNSTHFFLVIKMLNITVSPELRDTFGTSDPAHFGWPRNMTIRFIVNRGTGEAYLIDGKEKRYVGILPLYLPEFNPKHYLQAIKENAFEFVRSVKSNPWTIEGIIEKAKLANSSIERDEIITGSVMNFTDRILKTEHLYLGLPLNIDGNYVRSPVDDIDMWRDTIELMVNISAIRSPQVQNLTKKAVLEYLKNGNESGILEVVNRAFYPMRTIMPPIATNDFISVNIPPVYMDNFFPLPLPEEYSRELGAKYAFVLLLRNVEKYPYVHYDPRVFDSSKISGEWKNLTPFLSLLKSQVYNGLSNILYSGLLDGEVNYTQLEKFRDNISSMIDEYLRDTYGITTSSEVTGTQHTTDGNSGHENSSEPKPGSSTRKNKQKICGPGSILLPILLALVLKVNRSNLH